MRKSAAYLAAAFTTASLFTGTAGATTLCVDPGNAPPCHATIQAAVDAAAAGDVIEIAAGVYSETITIAAGKDGLTLTGDKKKTIVDGTGLANFGISVDSANVHIQNLVVRHTDSDGILVQASATGAVIQTVTVLNSGGDGINAAASGVTVSACRIESAGGRSIGVNASGFTASDNFLRIGDNGCIEVLGNGAQIHDNTISLCEDAPAVRVIGDQATVGDNNLQLSEDGVNLECDPCTGGTISGNTIVHSQDNDAAIYVRAASAGVIVENNSVTSSTDPGIRILGTGIILRGNTVAGIGSEAEDCIEVSGTNHTIQANKISDCHNDGIRLSGSGHVATGNSITGALRDGIDIEGDNCTVTGNKATKNGAEGIDVSSGTNGNTVTGNTLSDNRADFCDSGTATSASGNTFTTTSPCGLD